MHTPAPRRDQRKPDRIARAAGRGEMSCQQALALLPCCCTHRESPGHRWASHAAEPAGERRPACPQAARCGRVGCEHGGVAAPLVSALLALRLCYQPLSAVVPVRGCGCSGRRCWCGRATSCSRPPSSRGTFRASSPSGAPTLFPLCAATLACTCIVAGAVRRGVPPCLREVELMVLGPTCPGEPRGSMPPLKPALTLAPPPPLFATAVAWVHPHGSPAGVGVPTQLPCCHLVCPRCPGYLAGKHVC